LDNKIILSRWSRKPARKKVVSKASVNRYFIVAAADNSRLSE